MPDTKLQSRNITIGSGQLYIMVYTGVIPADSVIETEANRLGHIKNGATITYEPTFYEAKDDMGLVAKTVITEEKLTLKSGVMTWNMNTLNKLTATGEVTTDSDGKQSLKLGGIANADVKSYLLRFVHASGKQRITIVGNNQAGFELGFTKDEETVIDAEFHALPMDNGRLMIYDYSEDVTTTQTVTQNLTHVNSTFSGSTVATSSPLNATLTADTGYTISSVTVTMGGEDITSEVYTEGTGVVHIVSVTAAVVITATATE